MQADGRIGVGSLTPHGNVIGPKAWALIETLAQHDDYLGAVLEVVDEAASLDTARMSEAFADHEVEHHRIPRQEILPIPDDCLADVKARYDR
jgi:hypothetical protein